MQRANSWTRASADQSWAGRFGWSLLSLAAFLLFWEILALLIQHKHLPPPTEVAAAMAHEFVNGELAFNISITLARVAAAFVIAMFIGSAFGILLGRFKTADRVFDSWVILFLNLPALVIIILCYVTFGILFTATAVIAATSVRPNQT